MTRFHSTTVEGHSHDVDIPKKDIDGAWSSQNRATTKHRYQTTVAHGHAHEVELSSHALKGLGMGSRLHVDSSWLPDDASRPYGHGHHHSFDMHIPAARLDNPTWPDDRAVLEDDVLSWGDDFINGGGNGRDSRWLDPIAADAGVAAEFAELRACAHDPENCSVNEQHVFKEMTEQVLNASSDQIAQYIATRTAEIEAPYEPEERQSNPRGRFRLGRRHEKYGPKKMAADWALHATSSHPYSLLGKTTNDEDVFINNLDAMGLAFHERTFRSRPGAHAYSTTNKLTGHTTDWLFDDDTEAWVREGETRAQRESASSDPENRVARVSRSPNPLKRFAVETLSYGRPVYYASFIEARNAAEELAIEKNQMTTVSDDMGEEETLFVSPEEAREQAAPPRRPNPARYSFESDLSALSRDAFDNGLSNSDASLDDAHDAFSHHHDRTFVEEQVEFARQNVDVDADAGDFLVRRDDGTPRTPSEVEHLRSEYRSAFGSGFRQRLERALPRWIAEETREQNPVARFKRGVFRLERGPSYGGLTLGEEWNGFEVPYFDLAIAEKVVRDNGGRTRLEGSTLRYVLPDDNAWTREPSAWTAEKPVLVKGVAYYSFQGWAFFDATAHPSRRG